ncbi:MAG: hypothetical protein ABI083_09060, partial [Lapillicoccus sp.]
MTDVEDWDAIADAVMAAAPGSATRLHHVLVRLGLSSADRNRLRQNVVGRQDPAGLLLADVAERAVAATMSPYATPAPTSDRQMDAAITAADALLTVAPAELASALAAADLEVLAALPADRAGRLLADLATRLAGLPPPQMAGAAIALSTLGAHLDLARVPVVDLLRVAAPFPASVAAILAGAPVSRLLSGCADACAHGVPAPLVMSILEAVTTLRPPGTAAAGSDDIDEGATWRGHTSSPPPPSPAAGPESTGDEGPNDDPESTDAVAPPPTSRTAYPRLDVDSHQARPEVVVLDEPFDVVVGLQPRKDPGLVGTGRILIGAGEVVDLDLVVVYDPQSLKPAGDSRAHVMSTDADPYPSATMSFIALDGEDLSPERRIGLHLLRDGKVVGVAWRTLIAVASAAGVATAAVVTSREPDLLDLTPLVDEEMPDLVVTVCRADARDGTRFVWTAYPAASGVTVPDAPNDSQLDADATGFAAEIRRVIQFSQGPVSDYYELAGRAKRIGRAIP